MDLLEISSLCVRKSKRSLLSDINVSLALGSITAIIGPNGSGKSTLLNCMSGQLKPSEGAVLFEGQPIGSFDSSELARKRALLPQLLSVPFGYIVEQIVLMGRLAYQHGWSPSDRDYQIAQDVLAQVGMTSFSHRTFNTLSGGERQRVQLARVLAQLWEPYDKGEPGLLLLDEPATYLDWKSQRMPFELAKQWASRGITVCMVVQELPLAFEYADQVVYLEKGALEYFGAPEGVKERLMGLKENSFTCSILHEP